MTRRSVRVRLVVGLGCIVAPLLLGWALTGMLFRQTVDEFRGLAEETVSESRGIAELRTRLGSAEDVLEELVEEAPTAQASRMFQRETMSVDRAFAAVTLDTGAENQLLESARRSWRTARDEGRTALAARARGGPAEEPERFFDLIDQSAERIERLELAAYDDLGSEAAEAEEVEAGQAWLIVGLALLTAALAYLVARWLAGSILRPVARLKRAAASLQLEDLDVRLSAERPDELGDVALAFNDMAERLARNRDELEHKAFHDSLTGLPNRILLHDRIEHAEARTARTNAPLGVLLLDLDDFKGVNDTLGHSAGDELLRRVAERLRSAVRDKDTPARLGGDEFAVLLEDLREPAEAVWIAERILHALSEPYELEEAQIRTTVSIGVVLTVGRSESAEDLMRNADLAMYSAKADGKNRVKTFLPQMYAAAIERQALESELRLAIERDELYLQYQPLVDLTSGEPYGFEALVRWDHPRRGPAPPEAFIPVAEETGLIVPIGKWVIEEACQLAARLPEGNRPPIMSVNVSARQLSDPGLLRTVADALAASGLDPHRLQLEITESVLSEDGDLAIERLRALKELGVSLAVDDFGTGYSSLSRLRSLPVDMVKIDKSFVDGVAGSDSAFVTAILRLADDVDMATVAEGVETLDQSDALLRLGCTRGQGYLFARPLDPDAAVRFLREHADAARDAGTMANR